MEKNLYPCTQNELYETADTAWNLFLMHIGDFTKFNKAYTTTFYEAKMKSINDARSIKERYLQQHDLKVMRKGLIKEKREVLNYFTCLKHFVKIAFNKGMANTVLIEMGKRNLRAAVNNNWLACESITRSCTGVLDRYKTELLQNAAMPEEFINECAIAFKKFTDAKAAYVLKQIRTKTAGTGKVSSSNAIYNDLTTLIKFAQFIYRDRPDMQAMFRFDRLLKTAKKNKKQNPADTHKSTLTFLSRVAAMF